MKVGLMLGGLHPWGNNAAIAEAAGAAGIDSIWAADRMSGLFHPELWPLMEVAAHAPDPDGQLDPYCLGAALGPSMPMPFGVCMTDAIRRRAPDVARTMLTLHQMCTGGFELVVGTGEAANLVPFGYPFQERAARTEAFLADLRSLLDSDHRPSRGAGRLGLPRTRPGMGGPRLWVFGADPETHQLAGTFADGWLAQWPTTTVEYAIGRNRVNSAAALVDRPTPAAGLLAPIILGDSRDQVEAALDRVPLARLLAVFASASQWHRHGLEHPAGPTTAAGDEIILHGLNPTALKELAERIPVELLEEVVVLGSADDVARQLKAYESVGCDGVIIANWTGLLGNDQAARTGDARLRLGHLLAA